MLVTFINGCVGLALTFGIGLIQLRYSPREITHCIIATQIAALVSLLVTLQLESVPWIKRRVLNWSLKTWMFFVGLYLGLSILISPELRRPKAWLWLFVPLVLTNGFTILAFGPIQDRIVRRRQRRARLAAPQSQ